MSKNPLVALREQNIAQMREQKDTTPAPTVADSKNNTYTYTYTLTDTDTGTDTNTPPYTPQDTDTDTKSPTDTATAEYTNADTTSDTNTTPSVRSRGRKVPGATSPTKSPSTKQMKDALEAPVVPVGATPDPVRATGSSALIPKPKNENKAKVTYTLKPSIIALLDAEKERTGYSRSEIIEKAVAAFFGMGE